MSEAKGQIGMEEEIEIFTGSLGELERHQKALREKLTDDFRINESLKTFRV